MGVVITVTLGTGVGAGLFMDGKLVPNLEAGKIFLANHSAAVEQYMSGRIKREHDLNWHEYGERLNEFCLHIEHVFSPPAYHHWRWRKPKAQEISAGYPAETNPACSRAIAKSGRYCRCGRLDDIEKMSQVCILISES